MKNRIFNIIVVVLFLIVAGTVISLKNRQKVIVDKSEIGKSIPVVDAQLPKLLDLGSHKCIPCKMMMPILDTLREVHAEKLDVEFIDVWQDREAGARYGIRSIPTQIIYDESGKELFRHVGFWSREDIESKLKELGIKLGGNS